MESLRWLSLEVRPLRRGAGAGMGEEVVRAARAVVRRRGRCILVRGGVCMGLGWRDGWKVESVDVACMVDVVDGLRYG